MSIEQSVSPSAPPGGPWARCVAKITEHCAQQSTPTPVVVVDYDLTLTTRHVTSEVANPYLQRAQPSGRARPTRTRLMRTSLKSHIIAIVVCLLIASTTLENSTNRAISPLLKSLPFCRSLRVPSLVHPAFMPFPDPRRPGGPLAASNGSLDGIEGRVAPRGAHF